MPPSSTLPRLVLAAACVAATASVGAAGFGPGLTTPVLGQALDFAVQVRTDAGETIAPECVFADVAIGERRVPPGLVRTVVEVLGPESARIRVLASPLLDEPVVTVSISSGCASRVARRYVLFVEPPLAPAPAVPAHAVSLPEAPPANAAPPAGMTPMTALAVSAIPAAALPVSGAAAPAAAPATIPTSATGLAPSGAAAQAVSTAAPDRAPADVRQEPARRVRRTTDPAATAVKAAQEAPASKSVAKAGPAPTTNPTPAVAKGASAPRLRLEAAEPPPVIAQALVVEQALEAVAQAASAARAAASAASAAADRIATLERTVEQLRGEAKAQQEAALVLRERLARADSGSRWFAPLVALALLLVAVSAWLAWRLSALQRLRSTEWKQAAQAPAPTASEGPPSKQATLPIPFVTSEIAGLRPDAPQRSRSNPAWPPPATAFDSALPPQEAEAPAAAAPAAEAPADPVTQRTLVLAPRPGSDSSLSRDVSIEELIDLEQQAEFFVVLGQDDAAVDLLVEHLRNTGGSSPLPYLKLLEIYRRRGDREAYERMRARFNRRFNAYAPEWGVDLGQGRTLEDYADIVPRLQQVWDKPLDAMAELEALLFGKSRGELFDLPAYREVLFLYSLARDLLDREALDTGSVDLLLPMSGDVGFEATAPYPRLGLESDAMPLAGSDDHVTAPVDLDLSRADGPDAHASIFDPMLDQPAPRRG